MNNTSLVVGSKVQLDIVSLGTFMEGVAHYQGYTVFVPFCLVGEKVIAVIEHVKRNIAYGRLVDIVSQSPQRVVPPCPYYMQCGGCQLQHASYQSQLCYKHDIVANNLGKIGNIHCHVMPTVPSAPEWRYRNKIALPVGGKAGDVVIGMYRNGTHDIVPVDSCMLVDSWADRLIEIVRQFANANGISPYDECTKQGKLKHIVARYIDGQLLVMLVINGRYSIDYAPLERALQDTFQCHGLFVNINTKHNNVILGDSTYHIAGIPFVTSSYNGIAYNVQPESFFQVNDNVRTQIYGKARELLIGSNIDVLIDCYSGVGLISSAMYSDSYDTYAIEIDGSSVADANAMKKHNNLTRLTNICGDANIELPLLFKSLRDQSTNISLSANTNSNIITNLCQAQHNQHATSNNIVNKDNPSPINIALIVDPPRKGLGRVLCDAIIANAPNTVVYISCDSATLARDLSYLSNHYDIQLVQPYDMFPMTRHVETLVHLTHKAE